MPREAAVDETWRIGELAEQAGITVRTLHHYDRIGLLSPSRQSSSGHRCYTGDDVRRLHRIIALRGCGLSLVEIGHVLAGDPGGELAGLLRRQLGVVDERIQQAVALRVRLLGVLDSLKQITEPSIADILRLIEETTTMNQPLTTEEFERLKTARATRLAGLSAEELSAHRENLRRSWAALRAGERAATAGKLRATLPVTGG